LELNVNYCPVCGEAQLVDRQSYKRDATFLTVLIIFTILGSVGVMARGLFYEVIASIATDGEGHYYRGWIFLISGMGTFVGAIMMIMRKLSGLYVYTLFQSLYIITAFYAALTYSLASGFIGLLAFGIAGFFLIPSAAFLGMFWLSVNRNHLS